MKNNINISPILKWVGGKRQILPEIKKYVPKTFDNYYEPFLGGGALLFDLKPMIATVNDINSELINMYQVVKSNVEELILDLSLHKNEKEYFYEIRSWDRDYSSYNKLSPIKKASRLIYLNKTCYNGLFRVNQAGQFNTPFGNYKNPNIVNSSNLRAVSEYFNQAEIEFRNTDFEIATKGIEAGAFIYIDPPYDPLSESSSFTYYAKDGFSREEQVRLKLLCDKLSNKGVKFLLSNSSTDFIHDLYKEYKIEIIQAKRNINSVGISRGKVDEVLVRNYE